MFNRNLQRWVCCLIVAVMPAGLMAAENGSAIMSAKGDYSVNGVKAKNSAILSGDRVSTGTQSEAVIRTKSSAVVVPENSSVVYGNDKVQLASGQVLVATKSRMSASMGDVKVKPAGRAARYELSATNGVQRIAALEGDLIISNGTQTYTLPAGKQMTRPMRAAPPQAGGEMAGWAIGVAVAAVAAAVVIGLVLANNDEADEPITGTTP